MKTLQEYCIIAVIKHKIHVDETLPQHLIIKIKQYQINSQRIPAMRIDDPILFNIKTFDYKFGVSKFQEFIDKFTYKNIESKDVDVILQCKNIGVAMSTITINNMNMFTFQLINITKCFKRHNSLNFNDHTNNRSFYIFRY